MAEQTTSQTGSADLQDFRARCASFLDQHATEEPGGGQPDLRGDIAMTGAKAFQCQLFAAGLAGLSYSKGFGGRGLSADHEAAWRQEAANHPRMTAESLDHPGPPL